MTTVPAGGRRRPTDQEAISLELVSGLLMIIGFIAFGYLFYSIVTNDEIREVTQGPEYVGIGAEVHLVEPEPNVENQAHFSLAVDEESLASEAGLVNDDILQAVGETELNAEEMSEEDLTTALAGAFTTASNAGDETIALQVYRDGESITLDVPLPDYEYLFELRVPSDDVAAIGLEVESIPAQDLTPYFELTPLVGGPADLSGVMDGDRLISVDDIELTSEIPIELVRDRIQEENLALEDDDFEINIEFQRLEDGRLQTLERAIPKDVPPSFLIAYLNNFGFVVPLLTLLIGFGLIRLGGRLRQYDIVSARWAQVAFMWIIVGLIVAALRNFWVEGKGGLVSDEPFNVGDGLNNALPLIIATIPLIIAFTWLNNVINIIFKGEETLTSRNTRFAWSLLIPTLAVLVLVAARPLEQTFTTSLTDDVFGATRPARWVGIDNYTKLISLRPVLVDCQIDEETDDCARTTGVKETIIWEESDFEAEEKETFRSLSREEREDFQRHQEATTWRLLRSTKGLRILGKDPVFLTSIGNTLRFTVVSVILELVLGLIIALVVNSSFKGRGLMRTAMLVPWAIPTVVAAALWDVVLRPDVTGIFNVLLKDIGLIETGDHQWLTATGPWMNSIIAVDVWKTAPFMALLLLAGLQVIPGDVYEAASVDGAGRIRQFFSITLPLLRPTIAVALIFRTLDALRAFDVFQVLLDPTRPSMAYYNYDRLVSGRLNGYASAVGVLIFIMILVFTVLYVRFVGIEQE